MPDKKDVKIWIGILISLVIFTGDFGFFIPTADALGISPPLVTNHQLLRGSHFEATVYINQGAPKEALKAQLTLNFPDKVKKWITINPGGEFTIPVVQLFPIQVIVDIPSDAALGNYQGEIKITTQPAGLAEGQVTIGIGAAIALDFSVVEKEIIDFAITLAKVEPMEEGWPVKVSLTINNKGNTNVKPYKVSLDVFNMTTGEFLGSSEVSDLKSVGPFQSGNTVAQFPLDLKIGSYWAMLKVYKTESEIIDYKLPFDVVAKGTLPRPAKSLVFWLSIAGGAVLAAVLVFFLWKFSKKSLVKIKESKASFKKFKKKFKKVLKVLREK